MWPFPQTPAHRLHHRILKRLRWAYLVTEDLERRDYLKENQSLVERGRREAKDDAVLYPHWLGQPLPANHASALNLEERLWKSLGDILSDLNRLGFHQDAFAKEVAPCHDIATALQDLLQVELRLVTHPEDDYDTANTDRIRARIAHYLIETR